VEGHVSCTKTFSIRCSYYM